MKIWQNPKQHNNIRQTIAATIYSNRITIGMEESRVQFIFSSFIWHIQQNAQHTLFLLAYHHKAYYEESTRAHQQTAWAPLYSSKMENTQPKLIKCCIYNILVYNIYWTFTVHKIPVNTFSSRVNLWYIPAGKRIISPFSSSIRIHLNNESIKTAHQSFSRMY